MFFNTPKELHNQVHRPSVVELLLELYTAARHLDTDEHVEETSHQLKSKWALRLRMTQTEIFIQKKAPPRSKTTFYLIILQNPNSKSSILLY